MKILSTFHAHLIKKYIFGMLQALYMTNVHQSVHLPKHKHK